MRFNSHWHERYRQIGRVVVLAHFDNALEKAKYIVVTERGGKTEWENRGYSYNRRQAFSAARRIAQRERLSFNPNQDYFNQDRAYVIPKEE